MSQPKSSAPRSADEIVTAARALQPLLAAAADETERERRVPVRVMDALEAAGLFRIMLPRSLGGEAADILTLNRTLEALAAADASPAWNLAQALVSTHAAGFLPRETAREVFCTHYGVIAWGPPAGMARSIAVEGGYRTTGKWRFASGSSHARWFGGHSVICGVDGKPKLDANGRPQNRTVLFRPDQVRLLDTWYVIGLKGTRSEDYEAVDQFVPEAFSTWRDSAPDRVEDGPLYNIQMLTLYGIAFSGVALGITGAMLAAFKDLAAKKVSGGGTGSQHVLCDNAVVQSTYSQALARFGRARAYLHEMLGEIWAASSSRGRLTLDERARLRLAITGAITEASAVVTTIWQAAGSSAIYEGSPFERRFRDMHTLTAHGQSQMSNFESAGQALFGTEPAQRL